MALQLKRLVAHSGLVSAKYHAVRGGHDFQWGAELFGSRDHVIGGGVYLDPPRRTFFSSNLFAHDKVTLIPQRFTLTLGAQALYTNFSDREAQPTIRAAWMPTARVTVWSAISRAVRTPIRIDVDLVFEQNSTRLFEGNDDLEPERVVTYEVGGRFKPNERLAFAVAGFFNIHNEVPSYESATSTFMARPWTFKNTTNVESTGVETMVYIQHMARLFVKATYRYLEFDLTKDPGSGDFQNGLFEASDPRHVGTLNVRIELPRAVGLDLIGRGASRLPRPATDGYRTMDARLAWRLALTGRDLTEPHRRDFLTPNSLNEEIGRSPTFKTTWRS